MNILIINYEFPPIGGGGGAFCYDLAVELAKKCDVDVLTSGFSGLKKRETIGGFNIHRVPIIGRTSPYYATVSSMLSFEFTGTIKGAGLLRKKKYDIINTHFAVPTGPVGTVLSFVSGVPNVLSIHGSDVYNPVSRMSPHHYAILRWSVRNIMKSAAKIVSQSSDNRQYAEKYYRPGKDIDVIPLGLPEPRFAPIGRDALSMEKNGFYIISIGRMVAVKGYDHLLTALARLRDRGEDIRLILIGDGPERTRLENLAEELALTDRVNFLGWVSGERKFQYLSAADLYVMSSIHEGFGVVLLEAMYCGLPLVSTDHGGQVDIIKDEKNGLLVPPGDPEALADAIISLKQDPARREAIREHNKEYVKRFDISNIAERYLRCFEETITSKGTR